MADLFNVVFAGEISKGADPAAVRANIARIFNANDAVLDRLFSGQRVAVKKAVDQATAMKYRATLKQAGAVAILEPCDAQGKPLAPPPAASAVAAPAPAVAAPAPAAVPPPRAPSPPPVAPVRPQTMAERIAALAEQQAREAALKPKPDEPPKPADVARVDTWKLFPVGSVLAEGRVDPVPAPLLLKNIAAFSVARPGSELLAPEERAKLAPVPVVVPDISAIKVAPRGSDIVRAEEREAPPPVEVDIADISMAPPNTEVLREDEKRVVVPVVVDISELSMAPPGTELEEIREEKTLVNPDIGHLKLA